MRQKIVKRLDEISKLENGWDGYPTSIAIPKENIECVKKLIEDNPEFDNDALHLFPGPDGSIQLEWHSHDYDIEFNILNGGNEIEVYIGCIDKDKDHDEYNNILNTIKLITKKKMT